MTTHIQDIRRVAVEQPDGSVQHRRWPGRELRALKRELRDAGWQLDGDTWRLVGAWDQSVQFDSAGYVTYTARPNF